METAMNTSRALVWTSKIWVCTLMKVMTLKLVRVAATLRAIGRHFWRDVPFFQLWSYLSQLFFCSFYHASAYSPLLQVVFCITRTTNTTMSFVIVVSKTLQHAVERRIETSPDAFQTRGYSCQHLIMASSRSLLFSFATRETSDWRELKNARSTTFRSALWAGWTTTSMEKPFILPWEAKTWVLTCAVCGRAPSCWYNSRVPASGHLVPSLLLNRHWPLTIFPHGTRTPATVLYLAAVWNHHITSRIPPKTPSLATTFVWYSTVSTLTSSKIMVSPTSRRCQFWCCFSLLVVLRWSSRDPLYRQIRRPAEAERKRPAPWL